MISNTVLVKSYILHFLHQLLWFNNLTSPGNYKRHSIFTVTLKHYNEDESFYSIFGDCYHIWHLCFCNSFWYTRLEDMWINPNHPIKWQTGMISLRWHKYRKYWNWNFYVLRPLHGSISLSFGRVPLYPPGSLNQLLGDYNFVWI